MVLKQHKAVYGAVSTYLNNPFLALFSLLSIIISILCDITLALLSPLFF
jgi:hypothetical protein